MSTFTLDECRAKLHEYMEAETAILSGAQSYSIGGRSLTRANLKDIRDGIVFWKSELSTAQRRLKPRCRSVIPHG